MAQAAAPAAARRRELSPLLFGTVLFLSSETLLFGGLFAAYFSLRAAADAWPPPGVELDTTSAAIGTVLLIVSSFTMGTGVRAGRDTRHYHMVRWVLATLALGLGFLGIQLLDSTTLGFGVSSHAYGTMFFAMTGLHGLHVLAGVLLMLMLLGRAAQGAYRSGDVQGVEAIAYYWHFVDAVWIALFATIFLLR